MNATDLTRIFNDFGDRGPWTGADSTASVPLPDGRTLWLFSDTMLGPVRTRPTNHRRQPGSLMISNSAVIQDGEDLTLVHGGPPDAPRSLIVPPLPAGGWAWIGSAHQYGPQVMVNLYRSVGRGQFDFELTGSAVAILDGATGRVRITRRLDGRERIAWGAALLDDGESTYVYGSEYDPDTGQRHLHLARVSRGDLAGPWRYWDGECFSDWAPSVPILPGVGTAVGVQWVRDRIVLVTLDCRQPFGRDVVAYTAGHPGGPWSGPVYLFGSLPAHRENLIAYDARVHPHLAKPGHLLVSYNVHSLDPDVLFTDDRVYRPRFIDVPFGDVLGSGVTSGDNAQVSNQA